VTTAVKSILELSKPAFGVLPKITAIYWVILFSVRTNWRHRTGRPRQTWLRTVEDDLCPLNFGLATAKRRALNNRHGDNSLRRLRLYLTCIGRSATVIDPQTFYTIMFTGLSGHRHHAKSDEFYYSHNDAVGCSSEA